MDLFAIKLYCFVFKRTLFSLNLYRNSILNFSVSNCFFLVSNVTASVLQPTSLVSDFFLVLDYILSTILFIQNTILCYILRTHFINERTNLGMITIIADMF